MKIFSPRRNGAHGDIVSAFVLAAWAAKFASNVPAVAPSRPYVGPSYENAPMDFDEWGDESESFDRWYDRVRSPNRVSK
jgi:hypothetical protein